VINHRLLGCVSFVSFEMPKNESREVVFCRLISEIHQVHIMQELIKRAIRFGTQPDQTLWVIKVMGDWTGRVNPLP